MYDLHYSNSSSAMSLRNRSTFCYMASINVMEDLMRVQCKCCIFTVLCQNAWNPRHDATYLPLNLNAELQNCVHHQLETPNHNHWILVCCTIIRIDNTKNERSDESKLRDFIRKIHHWPQWKTTRRLTLSRVLMPYIMCKEIRLLNIFLNLSELQLFVSRQAAQRWAFGK